MENIKISVKHNDWSEVFDMLVELGAKHWAEKSKYCDNNGWLFVHEGVIWVGLFPHERKECREVAFQELKDMVVLKRNSIGDATHGNALYSYVKLLDGWYYFDKGESNKWLKSVGGSPSYYENLKPIEKKEMEEFLVNHDGKWNLKLLDSDTEENSYRVAVPSGADVAYFFDAYYLWGEEDDVVFYKNNLNFIFQRDGYWEENGGNVEFIKNKGEIIWQRSDAEYLMQGKNGDKLMESIAQLNNQETVKVTIDELKHRVGVDATLAERQATYGCFEDVAFVTESVMGVLSKARPNGLSDFPHTHRMALYMIASKMARIVNGDFNHLDSWHDIGGYAKLIENLIGDEDS